MSRKETDAIEYTLRKIREAVRDTYGRDWHMEPPAEGPDMDVVWTFEGAVIAKDYDTEAFFEIPYTLVNDEVLLGTPVPVESYYILKRLMEVKPDISAKEAADILAARRGVELTGPIIFKNEPERIAFAAVLVPGEPDLDFDKGEKILSEEEVERVANQWLADYANIDLLHSLNNVAVPVQSYTTYSERTVKVGGQDLILPKGTWILGSRLDEQTWKGVMNGTLTGYSVMGIRRTALKNLIGAMKTDKVDIDASLKKTLLKDLGPDWVAPFVSVVDTPAVPKSKWFVLKGKSAMSAGAGAEGSKISWFNRIMEVVSGVNSKEAEKAGRRYSDTTYQKMKLIFDTMKALMEEAEAERKERNTFGKKAEEVGDLDEQKLKDLVLETFKTAMPEALKDVTERLGKLESAGQEPEKQDEKPPEEKSTDPELLASEILKRLEKLESAKTGGMSKALKGQDGNDVAGKQNEDTGRDLYGRKRKGGRE